MPRAAVRCLSGGLGVRGLSGIDEHGNASDRGHELPQELQSLRRQLGHPEVDTCDIATRPGRLATRPSLTGSSPTVNTIGMVVVAPFAASAGPGPPETAMTATRRRTRSAACSATDPFDCRPSGIRWPRSRPRNSRRLSGLGEIARRGSMTHRRDWLLRNPITGIAACCARAASGQAPPHRRAA